MVFRLDPALPVHAYKTYEISSPVATHFRTATCDEAGCLAQRNGWKTTVDESTILGQRQAHYIRRQSGRKFAESREAGMTVFMFAVGQQCFTTHKLPLERPEWYSVRGGDYRGNPTREVLQHSGPDAWVNDMGEHLDRIARIING